MSKFEVICSKLRKLIDEQKLDALVIYGQGNVAYTTGYEPSMSDGSVHILKKDGLDRLLIHFTWDAVNAGKTYEFNNVIPCYDFGEKAAEILGKPGKIGVVGKKMIPYDLYAALLETSEEIVQLDKEFLTMRHIKSSEEIGLIHKASQLTELALEKTYEKIKAGMTELEIAACFEYEGRKREAQFSFSSSIGAGINSRHVAYKAGSNVVQDGDFIVIDVGLRYKKYCSDVSRTVSIGKPSAERLDFFNRLHKAYTELLAQIKPHMRSKDLHAHALTLYEKYNLGKLRHRCGHGCGIETSMEGIDLMLDEGPLLPGMTVCVELSAEAPCATYGAKLEDTIVITQEGYRTLSESSLDLKIL